MSRKSVSKMERGIEARYYSIKVALKALFDQRLTGREREVNSHNWHFLCHDRGEDMRLYQVNAGKFIYDMSAQELADLLEAVQVILDDYLLEGGEKNLWAMDYVAAEAQRGTLEAFNNLSQQSQVYASQTTLQQLLSSPGYLNQIAAARLTTFSGMNTGLLWLSALKPTTRSWHASRHGKVYTTEQVRDFYAENGNRYNCYCSQIPVLLNDDGSIFNKGLADKLATERKKWRDSDA